MKRSELTFAEGFLSTRSRNSNPHMRFDWDKAASIIKEHLDKPNLIGEAGLNGDWDYTGGIIFEDGKPTNEEYTYLQSNWATPTLMLSWDGSIDVEFDCYTTDDKTRFDSDSKWDEQSLNILGLPLKDNG